MALRRTLGVVSLSLAALPACLEPYCDDTAAQIANWMEHGSMITVLP